jgi:hypothetical protein
MKAVVVVTDSEAMHHFERGFIADGERGFTLVPKVLGSGKTGLKAGNRVHPGGASLLFTVVHDAELEPTLAFVRRLRDETGAAEATKIYVVPAEEA